MKKKIWKSTFIRTDNHTKNGKTKIDVECPSRKRCKWDEFDKGFCCDFCQKLNDKEEDQIDKNY